jgi:hypothetical protein
LFFGCGFQRKVGRTDFFREAMRRRVEEEWHDGGERVAGIFKIDVLFS